jgi:hypothetical protein
MGCIQLGNTLDGKLKSQQIKLLCSEINIQTTSNTSSKKVIPLSNCNSIKIYHDVLNYLKKKKLNDNIAKGFPRYMVHLRSIIRWILFHSYSVAVSQFCLATKEYTNGLVRESYLLTILLNIPLEIWHKVAVNQVFPNLHNSHCLFHLFQGILLLINMKRNEIFYIIYIYFGT